MEMLGLRVKGAERGAGSIVGPGSNSYGPGNATRCSDIYSFISPLNAYVLLWKFNGLSWTYCAVGSFYRRVEGVNISHLI